ncbi:fungal-specific transcription factor [Aspergillus sclerotioniger CBS 115572]|uniref:Fungal-specific transcription factor n=1 Tax=Aspergillus sclerotioniger CBS 115572 TaxID=1450535 RepID=A0A317VFU7_9EURO|nr:fungal-specific transcription factor [Aspergillus sclerotioniger CBS 115572]PWY71782.1 fungal-specific transcription factor [Aspergillus sclerotioniger CBS 115572]
MPTKPRSHRSLRKHVTTACIPCRDGKVKCGGGTPTCRNCAIRGKTCRYRQGDDKRKVPVRQAVALLARRVDSLVHYIRGCELPVPTMGEEDHRILKNVLDALELQCEDVSYSEKSTSIEGNPKLPNSTIVPTTPISLNSGAHNSHPSEGESLGETAPNSVHPPEQSRPTWEDTVAQEIPGDGDWDSDDEVTDQLSCRLGRLQVTHDGQLRYFGSTSNLTLLDALVDVTPPVTIARDAPELLESAQLDHDIDEGFERHLLELFFTWQDPSLHIIDAESFWRARAQSQDESLATPYYSRALSDAMCALGAAYEPKYHPDFVTFPRSLAEYFGDRAKILVELELDTPSIATIQALVLLSTHEASCTRDTRGWLYSEGMAMRLTLDLGLHLEMAPYVEKGIIPHQDAEVRRMVFWGVYLNEQFWGFYLGRSAQSRMDIVTVQKPAARTLSLTCWKPYPAVGATLAHIPFSLLCREWLSLYEIMLPLTDVLYGCSEISVHVLQELAVVTVNKLGQWRIDLPEELTADEVSSLTTPLPHVLTLHMQYHQFMIHCHKPYISRRYIQPQPPQGPGSGHARKMCIDSAVAIVQLLLRYERAYGFEKSNIQMVSFVFSAALILIFNTVPTKPMSSDQQLVTHLSTCFRALDKMASCFENARRTSVFLGILRRQWQVRRRSRRAPGDPGREKGFSESSGWRRDDAAMSPTFDQGTVGGLGSGIDDLLWCYSALGDAHASTVDFMGPNLCNILLSEGIPRAFV